MIIAIATIIIAGIHGLMDKTLFNIHRRRMHDAATINNHLSLFLRYLIIKVCSIGNEETNKNQTKNNA